MPEKAQNKMTNQLPEDFDGVFRFTNFTSRDFKAKWGGVEYTFPKESTSPMIIPGATPEEVQHIRKKFARELAIEEFYQSDKFKKMNDVPAGGTPSLYTDSDLVDFAQRCLEPLPVKQAIAKKLPKDSDENYSKDEEGNPITTVLDKNKSLLANGSGLAE